jgi:lipoprotein-releasing system permease protein
LTRRKQTVVAALGVMIGVAVFLFINTLSAGFTKYSTDEIFKNSAHIKVYQEDKISQELIKGDSNTLNIIVNPRILSNSKQILNPASLVETFKSQPNVVLANSQVNVEVFYNNGKSQLRGTCNGVQVKEADAMFNINSHMIGGDLYSIRNDIDAIVIGRGIAEKLNIRINDQVVISSSAGIQRSMTVRGIFATGNSMSDQSRSYINIKAAQALLKEDNAYVTTIYVNTDDADKAVLYSAQLQKLTNYKVEPWQVTNSDILSGEKVRTTMLLAISISILVVAAFGIYNILNMTVMQKMNDIAILKAIGFGGKDIIQIFVFEALIMGVLGAICGLIFGSVLIGILKNVYMGGPVGYFPIYFDGIIYLYSVILGLVVTLGAGYFPAKSASNVDPVEIFRK